MPKGGCAAREGELSAERGALQSGSFLGSVSQHLRQLLVNRLGCAISSEAVATPEGAWALTQSWDSLPNI